MKSILHRHWRMAVQASFCFLFSVNVKAQAPANDNCSGAIVLTSSTSCNPTSGTFLNATKTPLASAGNWVTTYTTSVGTVSIAAGLYVVECWGGGGAGGGASANNARGGGGGGGGYTNDNTISIGTTANYAITVGAGGTGGTGTGGPGGTSSFGVLVTAPGGAGGIGGAGTAGGGGAGGAGATFNGGNGSAAVSGSSTGAGGGGAGSGGNGGNAFGITGGLAGLFDGDAGAAGFNSGTTNAAGNNNTATATTYGGGGGGAVRTTLTSRAGGTGAAGAVRVSKCGDPNSPDVWYRFVASSTNPTIVLSNIDTDLVAQQPIIQLLSNAACGSQTQLAMSNTNTLKPTLVVGTTYYIRITTNNYFPSPATGAYGFDICIQDPLPVPLNSIDYSKSYINITDGTAGGTINQNDILEIRATLVVKAGTITAVSYYDTLKRNAGFIFKDSIGTRTNEGKNFATYTAASGDDQGWKAVIPVLLDTSIQINMGTGATSAAGGGGTLSNTSKPSLFGGTCVIMATYRVKVDTGVVGYGRKINYGGGAFRYTIGGTVYTISFPRDSLIVYPTLTACSDGVSPGNLIGSANNGNFGTLPTGSSTSGTQNGGAPSIGSTYNYETFSSGPNDYYLGVANNTSITNNTIQSSPKPGSNRVFDLWDITGDHTGAANPAKGNPPCDPGQPVSAANPCGYMLTVNSSYRTDKVFEYTASGVCSETYYEVSAWFKNLCSRCGCDVNGTSSGSATYIPTATGDSSGVRPNIAMQINGIDYYTTGELVYQGLSGTPTATDTLNNWVRRSFVFKTAPLQTSFKVTFRNNAPGGGGNDWAIDDIGLRTCYPTVSYTPPNPIVFMASPLTISGTVSSYYNSYTYYKWQKKPVSGSWADVVPASSGNATATYNGSTGQYEYTISYTIPGTATMAANSGDEYRMIVASNVLNLVNGCNFVPSTTFSLLPTDAPCALTAVNAAVAPQTGNIDWNKLSWSLGHIPTCCESALITYNGSKVSTDTVVVDITNDICIINLTLINSSTTSNQLFKTILHPGFSMQMNGNVRMGATSAQSTDSCIFIAQGGGTITVNGNTVIGFPTDNAYCIFGSSPDITLPHNYVLKGDSLTFNAKSFTNDKLITVTMNPTDTAYLVNNTNTSPYPNAVTFETLKIGDGVTATTVITSGSNQNSFLNNRGGALEVTTNGTLMLPADYTINTKTAPNGSLILRSNSALLVGGYTGGTTGSNFPANFLTYNLNAQSLVNYYGGSSAPQTIYGTTYGKLELRNGINASGSGRAQKKSAAAITSATSVNVNQLTDFTLGTLGSSAQTISSAGPFTVAAGSGLYCNANVVSGAGAFSIGNASYLGIGHAQGISTPGSATGNIQMTGGRTFTTTGNYTYNGIVAQITGNGLPSTVNDLYMDNPATVTTAASQIITGLHYLKQGVFDIGLNNKITITGTGTLNSITGKMKANQGLLDMNGSSGTAQSLAGSWFVNRNISTLVNSNTKGVTIGAAANDTLLISSALLYGPSTVNSAITTNNNLTLLSRDSSTARFGEIVTGSGNTITGNVNVEKYIRSLRKWRHLAWNTASSQTAKQSWMENAATVNANPNPGYGTIVTDEGAGWSAAGFDSRSVSGPSVKFYDPIANGYVGIPNTGSWAMNTQSAYYNFVRGDRSCTPANALTAATILRSTGTLKTGNQAFTITANKFGAVGNPYASAIDLRKLDTLNLTSTFYVWDPKLTGFYGLGGYQTVYASGADYRVLPGGGSYGASGTVVDTLESGQAMFVKARATAGTLTFKENAKTIGSRTMNRQEETTPQIFALLSLVDPTENTLVDGTLGVFAPEFSPLVDYDDAIKMANTSENVSFKRDGQLLALERRGDIVQNDTMFINLAGMRIHRYQWDINPQHMDSPGLTAFFIDKYLNTSTSLDLGVSTPIVFDVVSAPGSYAADRFMIVFRPSTVLPVRFTSISAVRNNDKTVTVKFDTQNEVNLQQYNIQYSSNAVNFATIATQLPTGNNGNGASYSYVDGHATAGTNYYRVQAMSNNGQAQYTAIAKVGPLSEMPGMSISPNPVSGGILNIRFANQPKGTYLIKVTNKIGQLMYTGSIQISNSNTIHSVQLDPNTAGGSYQVTITDGAGKWTTINFIVK